MKYFLIAGEASGDLHASHLMLSLLSEDPSAEFRFIGGDNMLHAAGAHGRMIRHYSDIAYMGFIPVLLHLRTIQSAMRQCREAIADYQPDCVIFVDYAGFNLNIAKWLRQQQRSASSLRNTKSFYFIAPKIWAWKEYRIKNFKRDIDEMFSILPFEKEFFEVRHNYPIHYVGNPTVDEVHRWLAEHKEDTPVATDKPTIAILPGSRRQEIKDNLNAMLSAIEGIDGYRFVIAGAPGVSPSYYNEVLGDRHDIEIVFGNTYGILSSATAALVTSGTATLETALFNVPQVVCYKTPLPKITRWAFNHIIKCKYISLVNLIADREVVPELFAEKFTVSNIRRHLLDILPGAAGRVAMLRNYADVHQRLGNESAPDNAARIMTTILLHQ